MLEVERIMGFQVHGELDTSVGKPSSLALIIRTFFPQVPKLDCTFNPYLLLVMMLKVLPLFVEWVSLV